MAFNTFTAARTFSRLFRAVSSSSNCFQTRTAATAFAFAAGRPYPGSLASISTQSSQIKPFSSLRTTTSSAPVRSTRPVNNAHPGSGRGFHRFPAGSWKRIGIYSLPVIILLFILGAGLEQAPNTGRWRCIKSNSNTTKEKKASVQKWLEAMDMVKDPEDDRVRLVRHVMKNLLETIQRDGVSLKPFLCDIVPETSDTIDERADQLGSIVSARSINVHVSKQLNINAFALLTEDITVCSGMLMFLDFDEDLIAAVLAHELAHILQSHSHEPHGVRDLFIYGIQWFLWGVHMHLDPFLNCLPMAFASTTLHRLVKNPTHQALEIEADTLSLKIMALAGYDPIHAARFYDKFAALEEKILLSSSSTCTNESQESGTAATPTTTTTKTVPPETLDETMKQHNERLKAYAQRRWYHSTHPSSRLRQQYLTSAMHDVREKFRASEKLRSLPIQRFKSLKENQGVSATIRELKAVAKTVLQCIGDVLVTIGRS
ncbi:hypothetical protein BGZ72_007759 [Mortierella alpina]|nr:hypothetical protein BGZ72_007759 [Mortierella alpina]